MVDVVKAWQCIGCGRIEGPQTCIGICQDRVAHFVAASEYENAAQESRTAGERVEELEALVRRLALATPREGSWEKSYRALQAHARRLLDARRS